MRDVGAHVILCLANDDDGSVLQVDGVSAVAKGERGGAVGG